MKRPSSQVISRRGELAAQALGGAIRTARQARAHQPAEAAALIDGMVRVVGEWKGSFEALAVPGLQIDRISSAFRRASDIGMAGVERLL